MVSFITFAWQKSIKNGTGAAGSHVISSLVEIKCWVSPVLFCNDFILHIIQLSIVSKLFPVPHIDCLPTHHSSTNLLHNVLCFKIIYAHILYSSTLEIWKLLFIITSYSTMHLFWIAYAAQLLEYNLFKNFIMLLCYLDHCDCSLM